MLRDAQQGIYQGAGRIAEHGRFQARRHLGFTMIEVLMVLVILSAVSVLTFSGLSRADDQVRLQRFASAMQQLDRLARVECETIGLLQIVVDADSGIVVVRDLRATDALRRANIPEGAVVKVRNDEGHAMTSIDINRSGRSVDYTVHVALGGHERTWSVAGLTGFIVENESHE